MKTFISKRPCIYISTITLVLILSLCFMCLLSCTKSNGDEEESVQVEPNEMDVQVKTVKVETGEMPVTLKALGVLKPAMQSPANVVSLASGIVSKVEVTEGQTVEAGTIIIRLDPRQADNALAKARAAMQSVESDLQKATQGGLDLEQSELDLEAKNTEASAQQAKLDADRQKSLLAEHLTSEKSMLDAEKAMEETDRMAKAAKEKAELFRSSGRQAELNQLQAAVEQAKADLADAQLNREFMDIRAPVAGRISGLKVNVGSAVDDQTVLAHVIGDQTAVVRSWISPVDSENIEIGASVKVHPVSSEDSLSGKVISIGSELDPDTGLVPVETKLDPNQSGLSRIGETVFTEITTKLKEKGFIVPDSSIIVEDDKASLYIVDDAQIAHAIPIEILTRTAQKAVVASDGLKEGVKVITDGNYNLPDGAHVVEEQSE